MDYNYLKMILALNIELIKNILNNGFVLETLASRAGVRISPQVVLPDIDEQLSTYPASIYAVMEDLSRGNQKLETKTDAESKKSGKLGEVAGGGDGGNRTETFWPGMFDLNHHEGGNHGGHTIAKHVGKTNEWLVDRLSKDPRPRGSTSFSDLEMANKFVQETIRLNAVNIKRWLNDKSARPQEYFTAIFSESVGYGYNRAEEYFRNIMQVEVVMGKSNNAFGFVIITSYPKI